MSNSLTFDIIKSILLFPFDFIIRLFKIYRPLNHKRDKEIVTQINKILREIDKFAVFSAKGPIKIETYEFQNSLFEYQMGFRFINYTAFSFERAYFIVRRDEDKIRFSKSFVSSTSTRHFKKDNIDFEELAKIVYEEIEKSHNKWNYNSYVNEWKTWRRETVEPIFQKYQLEYNYSLIRRALIISSFEGLEKHYYEEAEIYLANHLKDENEMKNFIEDVSLAYCSKVFLDKLTGG